jgi:hypothetical protein
MKFTSLSVGDDTMRKVSNEIGTIVLNNDLKISEERWNHFYSEEFTMMNNIKGQTLYLEIDGAMLPTRTDGKNGTEYKECKLGMAFSSDNFVKWTDKNGKKQHSIGKRQYTAHLGEKDGFVKPFLSLALANGYGKYENTVLIADGATWIRNLKNTYFGDCQQILDYYHLAEHISDYAKILFHNDEKKYAPWSREVRHLFKASKTGKGIELIEQSGKGEAKEEANKLLQYISNNINNIDYKSYIGQGYYIGSGAIESSNKTVIQRRLKVGAMRWNPDSGQAVLTLMSKAKSTNLWEPDVERAVYNHFGEPCPARTHQLSL